MVKLGLISPGRDCSTRVTHSLAPVLERGRGALASRPPEPRGHLRKWRFGGSWHRAIRARGET